MVEHVTYMYLTHFVFLKVDGGGQGGPQQGEVGRYTELSSNYFSNPPLHGGEKENQKYKYFRRNNKSL